MVEPGGILLNGGTWWNFTEWWNLVEFEREILSFHAPNYNLVANNAPIGAPSAPR